MNAGVKTSLTEPGVLVFGLKRLQRTTTKTANRSRTLRAIKSISKIIPSLSSKTQGNRLQRQTTYVLPSSIVRLHTFRRDSKWGWVWLRNAGRKRWTPMVAYGSHMSMLLSETPLKSSSGRCVFLNNLSIFWAIEKCHICIVQNLVSRVSVGKVSYRGGRRQQYVRAKQHQQGEREEKRDRKRER